MDARKYLGQHRKLRHVIKAKRLILENAEYSYIRGAMTGDAERVQTSNRGEAGYEDKAIELADLQADLKNKIVQFQAVADRITDTIYQTDDVRYMKVLTAKWIEDKSLEQCAFEQGWTFYYVRRLYTEAMNKIQDILNKSADIP